MAKGSTNGKDPCVSWYWNDWGGGTRTLSRFLKGCYMDLLEAQFNNGSLSLDEIKTVLGSDFGSAWPTLQKKFKLGENGLYQNERLLFETVKRKDFNKSRRNNLDSKKNMGDHMGNENEIGIEERKSVFIENAAEKIKTQDIEMLNSFIDYWVEHNENGRKMRFEMEKVFDISRRWGTWTRKNKEFKKDGTNKTQSAINTLNELIDKRGINTGSSV